MTIPANMAVSPEDCPSPEYHEMFRYCPSCAWVTPDNEERIYGKAPCNGGEFGVDLEVVIVGKVGWPEDLKARLALTAKAAANEAAKRVIEVLVSHSTVHAEPRSKP